MLSPCTWAIFNSTPAFLAAASNAAAQDSVLIPPALAMTFMPGIDEISFSGNEIWYLLGVQDEGPRVLAQVQSLARSR